MKKIKTTAYKMPVNHGEMDLTKKEGSIEIYKRRVSRDKHSQEKSWFTYEFEYCGDIFWNKNFFKRMYKIKDYSWPFLIELNIFQAFKLYWFNKRTWIQKTSFWFNSMIIATSISVVILTYLQLIK